MTRLRWTATEALKRALPAVESCNASLSFKNRASGLRPLQRRKLQKEVNNKDCFCEQGNG